MANHRARRLTVRLTAAGFGCALTWLGVAPSVSDAVPLPTECTASGPTVTCTYTDVGEHAFSVPAVVASVTLSAAGAQGGPSDTGSPGGPGGTASRTYAVPVGVTTLYAEVGGVGSISRGGAAAGGANGGGAAGALNNFGATTYGASGGGASDVRTGAAGDARSLGTRLVVGSGGGASCRNSSGGGPGQPGTTFYNGDVAGGGGTDTAGGSAGGGNATAGGPGTGGDGATPIPPPVSNLGGGCGGGGGFFGGGGGHGESGSGGGGSNYAPNGTTGSATTSARVVISYSRIATALATSATFLVPIGQTASDVASFPGPAGTYTGTVTFTAYGPDDARCLGTPAFVSDPMPVRPGATVDVAAAQFVPSALGSYRWIASYSGDAAHAPATDLCNAPKEETAVTQTRPRVATTAQASASAGGTATDRAILDGAFQPTGTVTFDLFDPSDPQCVGTPFATSTVPVSNSQADSGPVALAGVGTYHWRASYSGDANNTGATEACGNSGETTVVGQATPTLSTTATDSTAGGSVQDTATLSGGYQLTGRLDFTLFGAGDPSCTGTPVDTINVSANGAGRYQFGAIPVTDAGNYHWIVRYSGDANNAAVTGACGVVGETSIVAKATPTLSTRATGGGTAGATVSDTATVSGGFHPSGTLTFARYGPDDPTCTGRAVQTATVTVTGDGTYPSGVQAVIGACGDAGETSVVDPADPGLTTHASGGVAAGGVITDTATLHGYRPTGTLTFIAYGPADTSCTGTPVGHSTRTVSHSGSVTSAAITASAAGTYRFVVHYSGDVNNLAATSTCGATNESVLATAAAAASHPVTSQPVASTPLASSTPVATTGTPDRELTLLGAAALLLGVGLSFAGRRRAQRRS